LRTKFKTSAKVLKGTPESSYNYSSYIIYID
jgi:hypothetical protein